MDSRKTSTGGPFYHTPVMTKKVLDALSLRGGSVYVDGTFGGGGHSSAILDLERSFSSGAMSRSCQQ